MTTLKTAARETNHCDACPLHEFHCLNYSKHQVKLSDVTIGSAPISFAFVVCGPFQITLYPTNHKMEHPKLQNGIAYLC